MPSLVTPAMLAMARKIGEKGLETTVTLLVRSIEENDYGDSSEVWADAGDHMGWLRMMNQPVINAHGGLVSAVGVFRLHLKSDVEADEGDKVIVLDTFGDLSDEFIVQDVNTEDTNRVFTTLLLRKVQ